MLERRCILFASPLEQIFDSERERGLKEGSLAWQDGDTAKVHRERERERTEQTRDYHG